MESFDGKKLTASWRIAALAGFVLVGFLFLAHALYEVQVVNTTSFSQDQLKQSIRRVQVPGPRGRILDRNGVILADNRPSECIAYYVEELRQRGRWANTIRSVNGSIDRLAEVLGVPREISARAVSNHVLRSLPMPLLAWRDVGAETLARWAERAGDFEGVDVYEQPERRYPCGSLAAHLIGYVRRDRPADEERPDADDEEKTRYHFYLPEMFGMNGIERQYNDRLTGKLGERLIRVDARGYKYAVWEGRPAEAGRDVKLTLDSRLQRVLERELHGRRGAGVLLDARSGEVLALASSPAYDINRFVPMITTADWKTLNNDPALPLYNRAIQGLYAPGSTFKPVTAFAALSLPHFDVNATYDCTGVFILGRMHLKCWNVYGHGPINFRRAIEQSCNTYFCHLGYTIGYDAIYRQASLLGLGQDTGIDLPYERSGVLPTADWKKKQMRQPWWPADTCQIAIGQGLLLATPIQMAVVTATVANGGKIYRPFLVAPDDGSAPKPVREMPWTAESIQRVHNGMRDVVVKGTGRRLNLSGVAVCGKTGTAEKDIGGVRHKNTWGTAFAPMEAPEVAAAVVVEDGESGGLTVAPIVAQVLKGYFGERAGELVPLHRPAPEAPEEEEKPVLTPAEPEMEPEPATNGVPAEGRAA